MYMYIILRKSNENLMEIVWGNIGIYRGYHGIISSPMEWGYTKQFNNLVMRSCVSKLCRIYCADLGQRSEPNRKGMNKAEKGIE